MLVGKLEEFEPKITGIPDAVNLLLTICWAVLWIIPRVIVWGNFRKKAYLNIEYDDFESYIKKTKNIETIWTILGIVWIAIVIIFFASMW